MRTQHLAEQRDRARMRHQGRRLVEARALGRREGMVAAGIKIKFDIRSLGERSLDLLARFRRRVFVELGEMKHHRALDLRGLADIGLDADPVIADGAIDIGARRDEIGELAAEAEAERADLADTFRTRAQHLQCIGRILDRLIGIEALIIAERLVEIGFGIAEVDARLHPPEQIRRQHHITFFGIIIGGFAHRGIDAENLLQQQNAGTRSRGRDGKISLERAAIGSRDINPLSCHCIDSRPKRPPCWAVPLHRAFLIEFLM